MRAADQFCGGRHPVARVVLPGTYTDQSRATRGLDELRERLTLTNIGVDQYRLADGYDGHPCLIENVARARVAAISTGATAIDHMHEMQRYIASLSLADRPRRRSYRCPRSVDANHDWAILHGPVLLFPLCGAALHVTTGFATPTSLARAVRPLIREGQWSLVVSGNYSQTSQAPAQTCPFWSIAVRARFDGLVGPVGKSDWSDSIPPRISRCAG